MQLTEHFSFDELTTTGVAGMLALNHVHANKFLKQLKYTAEALEECRAIIGEGLTVSSGYRTPELNKVVGGSVTSKHTQGLCADFKPVTMSVKEAFKKLIANKGELYSVRKVIIEGVRGKEWIHLQAKTVATEPMEFFSTTDGKTYQAVV